MSPTRPTMSYKQVQTERTHVEYQERAYIAASRRSDRSLEARLKSAHRASAIHKSRTGRSLRITEHDVANGEMYEEEDDYMSVHGRGFVRSCYPNMADFNYGLAAYMASKATKHQSSDPALFLPQEMQPVDVFQNVWRGNTIMQSTYLMPALPPPSISLNSSNEPTTSTSPVPQFFQQCTPSNRSGIVDAPCSPHPSYDEYSQTLAPDALYLDGTGYYGPTSFSNFLLSDSRPDDKGQAAPTDLTIIETISNGKSRHFVRGDKDWIQVQFA